MYNGPLGLPFVLEDSTGSLTKTTLTDIYGRLTICFDESLRRPGRSVVMIRVANAQASAAPIVPNAVLDFDSSIGLGSVMFPPKPNMPMDSYVRKMSAQNGRFLASDGQEYKWTLMSRPGTRAQWTCSTSNTNYFVASYEQVDNTITNRAGSGDSRLFSVGDTWVHLVVELLTSLAIVRHISERDLKYS
ncbi:hypothetical protein FRB99_007229 [Tulasnella sp. 403]|nr:hypothetical protein FRB99_007229 [Tulasnella sp. 403]